jgi:DNA-binding PadR family transcriptional regulator
MPVDRELKRGTLEMILLRLLSLRPMYGYELISELRKLGGAEYSIQEGTLYPVLYRLESAGWVEPSWEVRDRGAARKYYRLTRAGADELRVRLRDWKAFTAAVNRLTGLEAKK